MKLHHTGLASIAAIALAVGATPALAQNATQTVDNAITDVGNVAEGAGNSIATGANSLGTAADNAVDVDITTNTAGMNATADPMMNMDAGNDMAMNDMAMNDMAMNDMAMVETTTTTREGSSGKGAWGLLGLAGLLSFLFRPKKNAIHLDERSTTNRI